MKIRDVMSKNPFTLSADGSIREAARVMAECDTGFIPVTDDQGRPIGVVTDRDITCRAVAQGKDPEGTRLSEVMTRDVFACGPDDDVQDVLQRMEERKIRRCVVVGQDGRPIGVLSPSDVATRDTESSDTRELNELFREVSRTRPNQEPGGEHARISSPPSS